MATAAGRVLCLGLAALLQGCGVEAMRLDITFRRASAGAPACTRLAVREGEVVTSTVYLDVGTEEMSGTQRVVLRVSPGQTTVDVEAMLFRASCDGVRGVGGPLLAQRRQTVPVSDTAALTLE